MKKLFLITLLLALSVIAQPIGTRTYVLTWDAQLDPVTFTVRYLATIGHTSPPAPGTNWVGFVTVAGTSRTAMVTLNPGNTYWLFVTAESTNQISEPSNILTIYGAPQGFRLR